MSNNNKNNNKQPQRGTPPHIDPSKEKASIGGQYNSGVTSDDPEEKDQINKKGSLYEKQPASDEDRERSKKQQDSKDNERIY